MASNYGKCHSCNSWVPKGEAECPHCGAPQSWLARLTSHAKQMLPQPSHRADVAHHRCVKCDGIVHADDKVCPHCGAEQTAGAKAARAVRGAMPGNLTVTNLVLGSVGLIFLLPIVLWSDMMDVGTYIMSGNDGALFLMGANQGVLLAEGETWRLVTACFLHIGILHLIFNGWALLVLGPPCEQLYDRGWYFFAYILSGIGGNLLSWWARGMAFANAGASGAIMGLIGIGIVAAYKGGWRDRATLRTLISWAVMVFIFGFMIRADNWAHFGGMITGAAFAFIVPSRWATRGSGRTAGQVLGIATVVVVLLCFFQAAQNIAQLT